MADILLVIIENVDFWNIERKLLVIGHVSAFCIYKHIYIGMTFDWYINWITDTLGNTNDSVYLVSSVHMYMYIALLVQITQYCLHNPLTRMRHYLAGRH